MSCHVFNYICIYDTSIPMTGFIRRFRHCPQKEGRLQPEKQASVNDEFRAKESINMPLTVVAAMVPRLTAVRKRPLAKSGASGAA